jgi:pSer/pThr/pTyr-binding forkhead associated (FHA) protein
MSGSTETAEITVQLVDPNDGHQLQAWSFADTQPITIGRGDDQRVVLADPYVSRRHAELRWDEGGWRVFAHGRNGVYVGGSSVNDVPLDAGAVFRLGPAGPALRYQTESAEPSGGATLSFDPASMIMLQMDQRRVEAETRDVIDTDYFQRLQETARALRQQRTDRNETPK